jgi:hypothetical protein
MARVDIFGGRQIDAALLLEEDVEEADTHKEKDVEQSAREK